MVMVMSLLVPVLAVMSVTTVSDPRPTGWVVDQAAVIDAAAEVELGRAAAQLHESRGAELVVVTIDDVDGTPKAFATKLFNQWHLGSAQRNDGVLVLLVVQQRRLEIETGDGLQQALPASWLAEMQRLDMVPHFKQGQFGVGLAAGVAQISTRLAALPAESDSPDGPGTYRSNGQVAQSVEQPSSVQPAPSPGQPMRSGAQADNEGSPIREPSAPSTTPPADDDSSTDLLGFGALGLLGTGAVSGAIALRRRGRRCRTCGTSRQPLLTREREAYLTSGQRAEEQIGSVKYTVLHCSRCRSTHLRRSLAVFSFRPACATCGFHTTVTSRTILRNASYQEEGIARTTTTCVHCNHSSSVDAMLPMLTASSSSFGDSSSSSFGNSSSSGFGDSSSSSFSDSGSSSSDSGGSSSGGGAGSNW
jgi:uncharacterized protein